MRRHDHTQTERGFPPINPPNCPSSPWSARTLIPGFSSSLSLGRFERVSCGTWIFTPLHPSLGQENHRPPPWRRPRRRPINTDLFPVHLLRSQKWDSLIISTGAASSVLLTSKSRLWPFFFPPPEFCWLWRQQLGACSSAVMGWGDEVTVVGVSTGLLPPGCSHLWRKSSSSRGGDSGKTGHSIDDVGQGGPGLGGREELQGSQRSVSVVAAEVDGRSHAFASLDRFLQLSENTGTRGGFRQCWCTQLCLRTQGFHLPFPRRQEPKLSELFNTLSCSVLAPHYSKTVRSLKYITHYFIPWKMLALQRAHLIKKNKLWFKYLGISYLSHCLRAFVQHWQASHSLTLLFSVVKTWTLWTPIPDFGTRHRVTKVELLSSLTQVSVYIPHDYICDSGKKQMLSLKWDMSSYSTELYSCEFSLLRKAREFHNGLVIHHTKKKIFPWSNRHFTASCWKDLAP